MRPLKLLCILLTVAAPACADPTVPSDQIVLSLKSIDGQDLPVKLDAGQSTFATVVLGVLAGSPSHSKCDYALRIQIGGATGDSRGAIDNCSFRNGESVTLKLDLGGPPLPVGPHEDFFKY